ncbi:MAG TPA: hypothetical protein DDZ65_06455, partial [Firmicutes bacterium]|nr:hypothetical protein [Bacillota bacterium]
MKLHYNFFFILSAAKQKLYLAVLFQQVNCADNCIAQVGVKAALPHINSTAVLGKPQGIDFLIDCIRENEIYEKSFFLIVGSGTEYGKLREYFDNEKPKNAKLMGHLPKRAYEMLVNSCDVGLIFLDRRFTIPNFPSRILPYMQASMPVLAATDVNTDVGKVIKEGCFGFWCESGDL